MSHTLEEFGIEGLSVQERMELIGLIWDSITDNDPQASVPEWHLREVERRVATADADPEAAIPWEEVRARLTTKP